MPDALALCSETLQFTSRRPMTHRMGVRPNLPSLRALTSNATLSSAPLRLPLPQVSIRRMRGPWLRGTVSCLVMALAAATCAFDQARMQAAAQRLGPRAVAAVAPLQAMLQQGAAQDEETKLSIVNGWFNRRILFREDSETWGEADHWASPLELLDKGQGDCEDFAIAKYFSLLALGTPASRLRLVYVRLRTGSGATDAVAGPEGQAHMVLAYYAEPGAEPLILDNLVTSVRPASRRPDLTPVFSFNSEGLWQGVGGQSAGDPQARLSRWRDVLAKARAEGFQ
jgi:predicted transglutaminase-like cysteine proteinase